MLTDFIEGRGEWDGEYRIVECARALSPSGLTCLDYALNPYGGCSHGCVYCYAPGVTHSDPSQWRVVRVKRNIPERLARELPGVEGIIGLGTVTDPYQYAERRFRLTQMCLEILRDRGRRVHVHTKSDLVLRDADLLREMGATVCITMTTVDDRVSKITEPGAPLPGARLDALRGLLKAGVKAYVLVAPVMSTLEGGERDLMKAVAAAGVETVYHDLLNLRNADSARLTRMRIRVSPAARVELVRAGMELGLRMSGDFDDTRPLRWEI